MNQCITTTSFQSISFIDVIKKNPTSNFNSMFEMIFEYYKEHNSHLSSVFPIEFIVTYVQYLCSGLKISMQGFADYCSSDFQTKQHKEFHSFFIRGYISFLEQKREKILQDLKAVRAKAKERGEKESSKAEVKILKATLDSLRQKINALKNRKATSSKLTCNEGTIRKYLQSPLFTQLTTALTELVLDKLTKTSARQFSALQKVMQKPLQQHSRFKGKLKPYAVDTTYMQMCRSNVTFAFGKSQRRPEAGFQSIIDVTTSLPVKMTLNKGNQNERDSLESLGALGEKDDRGLLIMDRGYLKYSLMQDLQDKGWFYVFRGSRNTNPGIILEARDKNNNVLSNKALCGLAGMANDNPDDSSNESEERVKVKDCIPEVGEFFLLTVQDFKRVSKKDGQLMIYQIVLYCPKEAYEKQLAQMMEKLSSEPTEEELAQIQLSARKQARFVLFTNLPPELFTAEFVATIYSFRWPIELFFKDLKSGCLLCECTAIKAAIRVNHFLASVLCGLLKSFCIRSLAQKMNLNGNLSLHKTMLYSSERMAKLIRECIEGNFKLNLTSLKKRLRVKDLGSWIKSHFRVSSLKENALTWKVQKLTLG